MSDRQPDSRSQSPAPYSPIPPSADAQVGRADGREAGRTDDLRVGVASHSSADSAPDEPMHGAE